MPDQSTASSSLARADKPAATAVRNAAARFATVSQLLRSASPSPLQAGLSRDADTSSGALITRCRYHLSRSDYELISNLVTIISNRFLICVQETRAAE